MPLKKREVSPTGDSASSPAVEFGAWAKDYPTLCEFLSQRLWEDATPRATGTILVFVEAGGWRCCVKDREYGEVAFVSGKTPTALLGAIEKGLTAGTLDFRPDKPQGAPRRGR